MSVPAALLGAPALASAQAAADAKIQTVEVVGTAYDARREDTASKLLVTRDDMLKFGDGNAADALKRQPGITIDSGPRGGVQMRGLGNGYTQLLINGEKAPAGFAIESLTPEVIERIEILRVATAELRSEAIAGTINIILRKSPKGRQRELKLGMASTDGRLAPTASWQVSDREEKLSYTFNGTLTHRAFFAEQSDRQTGEDANGVPNRLRTGTLKAKGHTDQLTMAPSVGLKLDNGDQLTLQSFINASKSKKDATIASETVFGPLQDFASNNQWSDDSNVQLRSDLSWNHRFAAGAKFDAKIGVNSARKHVEFRQDAYDVDGVRNMDSLISSHVRERGVTTSGKLTSPFFEDHALGIGWDASITRRFEDRIERQITRPNPDLEDSDLQFDAKITRVGFYLQDEWTISSRLSLYAGLRWELIDTSSEGNSFSPVSNRAHVLAPVFQSLWKLPNTENDQVRFSLSKTYKSPAINLLIPRPYTTTNNTALDPDTLGNPDLRPELALGMDIGYEHYWKNNAMVSVSAYARKIDNFIRNQVSLIGERWVSSPLNDGKATTRGIELDAKTPLKGLLSGVPEIDLRANLTRNWSKVKQLPGPDNRIDAQVRLSATVGFDYRPSDVLSMGSSFSYKSGGAARTSLNTIDSTGTRRELDIYALYKLGADSKLRLGINNLLQQDMSSTASYFDEHGRYDADLRSGSPATVRVTWEKRY